MSRALNQPQLTHNASKNSHNRVISANSYRAATRRRYPPGPRTRYLGTPSLVPSVLDTKLRRPRYSPPWRRGSNRFLQTGRAAEHASGVSAPPSTGPPGPHRRRVAPAIRDEFFSRPVERPSPSSSEPAVCLKPPRRFLLIVRLAHDFRGSDREGWGGRDAGWGGPRRVTSLGVLRPFVRDGMTHPKPSAPAPGDSRRTILC